MRSCAVALYSLGFVSSIAIAQPCSSVPKPANQTAYWSAHAAKKADPTDPNIIFLGDSITAHWDDDSGQGLAVWQASFAPLGGWTCGGSGDTTSNLLWRIGDGVLADRHPAWVVLLIGTNNLPGSYNAWWIWHGILRVMQAVRQRIPAARIMVVSILPRSGYYTARTDVNGFLAESVAQECGAVWLDVEADFASGATLKPGLYQSDGLHLTEAGYQVLADRILAAMQ